MKSITQLGKYLGLTFVCLMPYANCMGQICQNLDSTIVGVLTLCCFQNGSLHGWIDEDHLIDGTQYPLTIENAIYGKELTDLYALFLNRDSSELLVAVQAPGMNRGDVGMLMVVHVGKNDLEKLFLSRCTYTALPHFQTEQGVRIGMTQDELIVLKGDRFYKNKGGYIGYTSLSPISKDDPEAIEYAEKYGVGDLFLNVHFEDNRADWFGLDWSL